MSTELLTIEQVIASAIDSSVQNTFQMMVGSDIEKIDASEFTGAPSLDSESPCWLISLDWQGKISGTVVLLMDKDSALQWSSKILGMDENIPDEDVLDAAKELGNLVAGGAKSQLDQFDLSMSVPKMHPPGSELECDLIENAEIICHYQSESIQLSVYGVVHDQCKS